MASASDMLRAKFCLNLTSSASRDLAFIGAPEDDLDAAVEDAGLLQDRGERRAGPDARCRCRR